MSETIQGLSMDFCERKGGGLLVGKVDKEDQISL